MKLYRVQYNIDLMVLASDSEAAGKIADENLVYDVRNTTPEYDEIHEVTERRYVPGDWLHSIPYGGELRSCYQILGEEK